jgi:hypothetical protein
MIQNAKYDGSNTFEVELHIHQVITGLLHILVEYRTYRKISSTTSSERTFSHILSTKRRMDYLCISAHSAQQDCSGDGHLAIYLMTNQNGSCSVCVDWQAEVQTRQVFLERPPHVVPEHIFKIPLSYDKQH